MQVGRVDLIATDRSDIVVTVTPSIPADPATGRPPTRCASTRSATPCGSPAPSGSASSVGGLRRRPARGARGDGGQRRREVRLGERLRGARRLPDERRVRQSHAGERHPARPVRRSRRGAGRPGGRGRGPAEVGSARVGRVDGTLRLSGSDAVVLVDSVGSAADVTTSSGAVELGRAGGSVRVQSAYRMVRVGELVGGRRGSTARTAASTSASDVASRCGWTR